MLKKQPPNNEILIERLRNWDSDYIVRENERIKAVGEVFTPTALVKTILNEMSSDLFTDSSKTVCDPSCGNGQFLAEVLLRKLENGIELEQALSTIYGVDIMLDNVKICQDRLLCGVEQYRHIVEKNIVCADALSYDFSFSN